MCLLLHFVAFFQLLALNWLSLLLIYVDGAVSISDEFLHASLRLISTRRDCASTCSLLIEFWGSIQADETSWYTTCWFHVPSTAVKLNQRALYTKSFDVSKCSMSSPTANSGGSWHPAYLFFGTVLRTSGWRLSLLFLVTYLIGNTGGAQLIDTVFGIWRFPTIMTWLVTPLTVNDHIPRELRLPYSVAIFPSFAMNMSGNCST